MDLKTILNNKFHEKLNSWTKTSLIVTQTRGPWSADNLFQVEISAGVWRALLPDPNMEMVAIFRRVLDLIRVIKPDVGWMRRLNSISQGVHCMWRHSL